MAAVRIHPKCDFVQLNRNAAFKLKNGSPKFKDVFRSRCRARVKINREKFVNKLRNLCSYADVEVLLSILEPDKLHPSHDHHSDDELTEEEESIICEYEAMLAHEDDMLSDLLKKTLEVVCPVCQKTALVMEHVSHLRSNVVCSWCHIAVPTCSSLQEVGQLIESYINIHNNTCENQPQFHVLAEDDGMHICMLCTFCSYMSIII